MKKAVKKLMGDGGIRCGGSLLLKRMLPREFLYSPAIIHTCTLQLRIMFRTLLPPSSSMILSLGKPANHSQNGHPNQGWLGVEKLWSKQCTSGPAFGHVWSPRRPSGGVRLDVMTKEQREEWAEDEKNQTPSSWLVGWLVGCNLLMIDLMYYVLFCSFLRSGKHRLDSGILFLTQLTGKIAY